MKHLRKPLAGRRRRNADTTVERYLKPLIAAGIIRKADSLQADGSEEAAVPKRTSKHSREKCGSLRAPVTINSKAFSLPPREHEVRKRTTYALRTALPQHRHGHGTE